MQLFKLPAPPPRVGPGIEVTQTCVPLSRRLLDGLLLIFETDMLHGPAREELHFGYYVRSRGGGFLLEGEIFS